MKTRVVLAVVLFALALAAQTFAQTADKTFGEITAAFEGTWKVDGKEMYEKWEKTGAGFVGKGYSLKDNQEKISETLEIRIIDGKIFYLAIAAGQNNGATVKFELTKSGDGEFVFENPAHDFPKKLVYKKTSETEMSAQVLGEGGKGFTLKFTKVKIS